MDRAARIGAYVIGAVLLLAAVSVFAQSMARGDPDWKVTCGLLLGAAVSIGIGWFITRKSAAESSCDVPEEIPMIDVDGPHADL